LVKNTRGKEAARLFLAKHQRQRKKFCNVYSRKQLSPDHWLPRSRI